MRLRWPPNPRPRHPVDALAEVHVGGRRGRVGAGAMACAQREPVEPASKLRDQPRRWRSSTSRTMAHRLGSVLVCAFVVLALFWRCPTATSASCRPPPKSCPACGVPLLMEMPLRQGGGNGSSCCPH